MANENIGSIDCPFHSVKHEAHVRKDKHQKMYIFCEACGLIAPKLTGFQEYIKANAALEHQSVMTSPLLQKTAAHEKVNSGVADVPLAFKEMTFEEEMGYE